MPKHISNKSAQQVAFEDMKAEGIKVSVLKREKAILAMPKDIKVVFNP